MQRWMTYLSLLSVLVLTACGFHLKGLGGRIIQLPFESLYVDNSTSLGETLNTVLRRDKRIILTSDANAADAILKVYGEQTKKDILTINSSGNINEYALIFRVEAQVLEKGIILGKPMTIIVNRTLSYSDSAILGKQDEEDLLWRDMRIEAAEQVVRRLSYLKPNQVMSTTARAEPVDASIKP